MNISRSPGIRSQRGVTLLIALIMLVAMTLAGIVLFRQVGTGIIIARNLTFKQGSTAGADRGIEAARNWVTTQTGGSTTLEQAFPRADVAGNPPPFYYAAWCNTSVNAANNPDADGNGNIDDCSANPPPSIFDPMTYTWANSALVTADDGAGNRIEYVIHRMCAIPGSINAPSQKCVTIGSASAGGSKGGVGYGAMSLANTMQPYYRITTRVTGPMNTVVYTQAIIY